MIGDLEAARRGDHLHLPPSRGDHPHRRPHHRAARRPAAGPRRRSPTSTSRGSSARWSAPGWPRRRRPPARSAGRASLRRRGPGAAAGPRRRLGARRRLASPCGRAKWWRSTGCMGAGRSELFECLIGLRAESGRPHPAGRARDTHRRSHRRADRRGLVLVPEDRQRDGAHLQLLSVTAKPDHVQPLGVSRAWPVGRPRRRRPGRRGARSRDLAIKVSSPGRPRHRHCPAAISRRW